MLIEKPTELGPLHAGMKRRPRVKDVAYIPAGIAVVAGFAMFLPMYFDAGHKHYNLAGEHWPALAQAGGLLMVVGLVVAAWSLFPSSNEIIRRRAPKLQVHAKDSARLKPAHILLLAAMLFAVAIDYMKPLTLGFTVPGYKKEYHLSAATTALFPLLGILGTAVGSLLWGWLSDRVGRRTTMLWTAMVFIATSMCGAMTEWWHHDLNCFTMGLCSGGFLVIALSFSAEVLPRRHRGWMMVMMGGELALAYVISSWLATWLIPDYTWRMLWLVGAPFGLFLLVLAYLIPESPRFLLTIGQKAKAEAIMRRFDMEIAESPPDTAPVRAPAATATPAISTYRALFSDSLRGRTAALGVLGLSAGLVNYGFVLWLPINLTQLGLSTKSATHLLADSATVSLPAVVLVAVLYATWSSRKTMILACVATTVLLVTAVIWVPHGHFLLGALIVLILCGNSAMYATLAPFAAEAYPTHIRSKGVGLASGAGRAGGVLGQGLLALSLTPPGIVASGLIAAVATGGAVLGLGRMAPETQQRSLEELGAA